MSKRIAVLLLMLVTSVICYAQTPVQMRIYSQADSLGSKNRYADAQHLYDILLNTISNNTAFYLKILNRKAYYYDEAGDVQNAMKYAYKAIEISKRDKIYDETFSGYLTLALVFEKAGEFEKCRWGLDSALIICEKYKLDSLKANYYVRVSSYHRLTNSKDSALYYATKALDNANEYQNSKAIMNSHLLLGILTESTDGEKAIFHFNQVKNYFLYQEKYNDAATMYYNISKIYQLQKMLSRSLKYNDSAIYILNIHRIAAPSIIFLQRSEIYEALGNKEKALPAYKTYLELLTKEFDIQKATEVLKISEQYENNKKEGVIKAKAKENDVQKKIITGIFFFLVIISIVTISLFFSLQKLSFKNKLVIRQADKLNKTVHQKELLLHELQHRVKNNLQLIIGMLELQNENAKTKSIEEITIETQSRLKSMALLESKLMLTEDVAQINTLSYLTSLAELLHNTYCPTYLDVKIAVSSDFEYTNINEATSLSLIILELLRNSFKHAFKGRNTGEIEIKIKSHKYQSYTRQLIYSDNGYGYLPTPDKNTTSLGLEIIKGLVQQIKGAINIDTLKRYHVVISY